MPLKLTKNKTLWGAEYCFDLPLPVTVKILDAKRKLSLQVHPTGEVTKNEFWYVLAAKKDAEIILGVKREVSKEELRERIENNTVGKILRRIKVKKGDSFYIPSGTIHALGGGVKVLEIAEQNDITYRLFDWGRGREIQLEKALECAKLTPTDDEKQNAKKTVIPKKLPKVKGE
jgi:mannose-6-phosphate isomerase